MAFLNNSIFPLDINLGSSGGPTFQTDVIEYGNGSEYRDSKWVYSRAMFNAAYNIKNRADALGIYNLFQVAKGRFHSFRVKDILDFSSKANGHGTPARTDQTIGTGNGVTTTFQIIKTYTKDGYTQERKIKAPISGTLLVEVNGVLKTETTDYTVDYTTGIITFLVAPANTHLVKCGYLFHLKMRFNTDDLSQLQFVLAYGNSPDFDRLSYGDIPLIEVLS